MRTTRLKLLVEETRDVTRDWLVNHIALNLLVGKIRPRLPLSAECELRPHNGTGYACHQPGQALVTNSLQPFRSHIAEAILVIKNRPAPTVDLYKLSTEPGFSKVRNAARPSLTSFSFLARLASNKPLPNS